MAILNPPQPYYFNAVTKLCTGHEQVPLTWSTVRDADGQGWTVAKVIKIFLLIIPALLVDLFRMAVYALRGRANMQPQAVVPEIPAAGPALNPHVVVPFIQGLIQKEPTHIVLSYLGKEAVAPLRLDSSVFALTQLMPREKRATYKEIIEFDAFNRTIPAGKKWKFAEDKLEELILTKISREADSEVARLIREPRFSAVTRVHLGQSKSMTAKSVIAVAQTARENLLFLSLDPIYQEGDTYRFPAGTAIDHETAIDAVAAHCPKLELLTLDNCRTSEASLFNLFQKCSQLDYLKIGSVAAPTQISLRCLKQLAIHKKLQYFFCFRIPSTLREGVEAILKQCDLKLVGLCDAGQEPTVSSEVLNQFIKRQKRTLLGFWYYPFGYVTKESLALLSECERLGALAIRPAPDVTYQDIQQALSRRPQLETLRLRTQLSSQELIGLAPHLGALQDFTLFIPKQQLNVNPALRQNYPSMNAVLQFVDQCKSLQSCTIASLTEEQKQTLRQLRPHMQFP